MQIALIGTGCYASARESCCFRSAFGASTIGFTAASRPRALRRCLSEPASVKWTLKVRPGGLASMAGRESAEIRLTAGGLLAHLRLHFQLLLAPIFLWGYFLSGVRAPADFWLAFVAFHIFLYGGITAFNSYYDRDKGPLGGMRVPPPVTEPLLPFSLAVLITGALLAAAVNATFLAIYLDIMALGLAYSHPAIRLKARPLIGPATVAVGQGMLASLGGWASAEPDLSSVDPIGWLGILGATLVTVGFYPITQSFQVEEDLARGDVTFAAWPGLHEGSPSQLASRLSAPRCWRSRSLSGWTRSGLRWWSASMRSC